MKYSVQSILFADDGGKSFIGVSNAQTDAKLAVFVPYGYKSPQIVDSLDKPHIEQLRRFVKAIHKALKENSREGIDYSKGMDNPFAAISIIHDYLSVGRFIEYESYKAESNKGKIDFKRTLKEIRPKIVDDYFFYDTFITNKKRVVENSLVALLQGNIINDFMSNGGDLLFGQSLRVSVEPLNLKDPMLLRLLREERNSSFNSRKLNLINWALQYIQSLLSPNYETRGDWNYAIIAYSFWETVVDFVYGNQLPKNKTLYGTIYSSFNILDGSIDSGHSTEHDTIYEDDEYIFILDSKMYSSQHNLLSEDVLGKQFGYYMSARKSQPGKKVVNVLFLPWISGTEGFQYNIIEDPYNASQDPDKIIFTYTCAVNDLVDDYYYGRKRIGRIKNDFLAFIQQPSVRAFLDARHTSY